MMKQLISRSVLVLLLSLSCSDGKFEEGAEISDELPPQSNDPVVAGAAVPVDSGEVVVAETDVPVEPEDVPLPIWAGVTAGELATTRTEIQRNPLFAECANEPNRPIVADLYQLTPATTRLPDYAQLKAIKKICLGQLDIKVRKFSEGFPGVDQLFEWFSLDMNFIVKVPEAGIWTFKLIADDGANLYIAEQKIIDNDGLHEVVEQTGSVELKAGDANFRVSYFQGPRFDIALELLWKGPNDTAFTYIPRAYLQRPLK